MKHPAEYACGGSHQWQKPTQILSDEHRVIEGVLDAVDKLIRTPVAGKLEPWKKALEFFRHFADQCHHYKEEKVLFPAMEAHGIPREEGPIGMMLQEHEDGRAHVRAMISALEQVEAGNGASSDSLLENARAYLAMLREHIQKEDDILFRMADEAIPEVEQRQLVGKFEAHEAEETGPGVHEKYLKIAREIEATA